MIVALAVSSQNHAAYAASDSDSGDALPDPATASKAMQAMMTMVQIDSEKLKQAWK